MAVQRSFKRLEILRGIDQAILANRPVEAVAYDILHGVEQLLTSDFASLLMLNGKNQHTGCITLEAGSTPASLPDPIPYPQSWLPVWIEGNTTTTTTSGPDRRAALRELDWINPDLRCVITAPIIVQNEVVGVLLAGSAQPDAYSSEQIEIAEELRNQMTILMNQNQLHKEIQRNTAELENRVSERTVELQTVNERLEAALESEHDQRKIAEALQEVAATINQSLDLDSVLDKILDRLRSVIPFDAANIMLVKKKTIRVVRQTGYDRFHVEEEAASFETDIDQHPVFRYLQTQDFAAILPDPDQFPIEPEPIFHWLPSVLICPIRLGDMPVGFINLERSGEKAFTQLDVKRLQPLGYLNLERAAVSAFTPLDVKRLRPFVSQVAVAIQNAQLYAQAGEAAALIERQRLARELHDVVSQTLWSAGLIAEILPEMWDQDPPRAMENLRYLHRLMRSAQAEMRSLLWELRPQTLLSIPIKDLFEQLIISASGQTDTKLDADIDLETEVPDDDKLAIYRIAQEAVNNIIKHANARHASIRLASHNGGLELKISDDGTGFETSQAVQGQLGLKNMQERANSIHASLDFTSSMGKGTQVTLTKKYLDGAVEGKDE